MRYSPLCIGEALVEFNETEPGVFRKGFGGDTSNVAIAAARQGASVGYISRIGRDPFGRDLLSLWQDEAVSTDLVEVDESAATGHYFVTHDEMGHAFHYARKGSAASLMQPDALPLDAIASAKVLHLSGISLAISASARATCFAAMRHAREEGVLVSLDLNYRPALWGREEANAVLSEAIALTDILLPGLDDARVLTGLNDPAHIISHYLDIGPQMIALTMGAEGVILQSGTQTHVAPFAVEAKDATGAGDTFDGVFLSALIEGFAPTAAAERANAGAALSVCKFGAVSSIPSRADVESFSAVAPVV